ncbi:MAG: PilZ domain-containing protein [Candidatus Omnitrophota bacterium]
MWNGIDKRRFPRANYPCKITVRRKDQMDSVSSQTENIGIGGICALLPKDLGIFSPVEIQLDLLDNRPVIRCDGNIVWIIEKKGSPEKDFDTGVEFTNIAKDDQERINTIVELVIKNMS